MANPHFYKRHVGRFSPNAIQMSVAIMKVAVIAPAMNSIILFLAIAGFGVIKCTEVAAHEFVVGFTVVAKLLSIAADMNIIYDVVILCFINLLTHFCAPSYVV
jgi:hypothetical protein